MKVHRVHFNLQVITLKVYKYQYQRSTVNKASKWQLPRATMCSSVANPKPRKIPKDLKAIKQFCSTL